jgi:type I restriction enzyme S subunit
MSLPKCVEYKDSGVEWLGKVPAHWACVRLSALFREVNEPGSDELPILSVSIHDGVSDRELNEAEVERKVSRSDDRSKYKAVAPGDLTYNMMRAWQGGFGTVSVAGMVSPAYVVARPTSEFSTSLVEMILRTPSAVSEMKRNSRGITDFRLRLYWEDFKCIRVALPPLTEQLAITRFLHGETTKIDTLIAEQKKLIDLLAEKRQATISHAVIKGLNPNAAMKDSGVTWLGEVPAHWKVISIKHLLSTPITDGPHETPNFPDDGIPFVSAEAVSAGFIDFGKIRGYISAEDHQQYSAKYKPQLHDIYMVKSGATTGVTAIVESEAEFNIWSPIAAIRCDRQKADPYFLLAALRSRNFQEGIAVNWSFGTQQNIGMGILGDLPIALPPLTEQHEIAAYLALQTSKLSTLSVEAERTIALLKERRSALIAAAVTGQIDVRGVVPRAVAERLEAIAA